MMKIEDFVGIGLRNPHYSYIFENLPKIGWFEVHSENYFNVTGNSLTRLKKIREHYPISIHGVGLSLGSKKINKDHLQKVSQLISIINPFLISEHLSWSSIEGDFLPDLLPVPYTNEAFNVFKSNILQTQDFLKTEILIENPSSYVEFKASEMDEVDFLVRLCQETSAKILLDVNNVFVSCFNHGWDASIYLSKIPKELVKEIHVAGFSEKKMKNNQLIYIDTHDNFVDQRVWELYRMAIKRFGIVHSLIEWDTNIPAFADLWQESRKIYSVLNDS